MVPRSIQQRFWALDANLQIFHGCFENCLSRQTVVYSIARRLEAIAVGGHRVRTEGSSEEVQCR